MRAVFWEGTLCEAEMVSMDRLRPSRLRTIMSTALGVEGRRLLYSQQLLGFPSPTACESPGALQLLGVKTNGRTADRALETPTQPASALGGGPIHWDAHPALLIASQATCLTSSLAGINLPLLGPGPNTYFHIYLEGPYPRCLIHSHPLHAVTELHLCPTPYSQ